MTSALLIPDEYSEDDGMFHLAPTSDRREHECSLDCWCQPLEGQNDTVIHNSGSGLPH